MHRVLSNCKLSLPCQVARGLSLVLLFACVACGTDSRTGAPAQPAESATGATPQAPDIAAANSVTAYFHEQLVANGEEVQSEFGSALLTLGMNPRDLQQDTPEHAYQTAKQKVDELKDETLKRDLTRALFGAAHAPAR
ncbi:MAG: hypothetical protein ABL982_22305 [Vicinamibacterales bacterium]